MPDSPYHFFVIKYNQYEEITLVSNKTHNTAMFRLSEFKGEGFISSGIQFCSYT